MGDVRTSAWILALTTVLTLSFIAALQGGYATASGTILRLLAPGDTIELPLPEISDEDLARIFGELDTTFIFPDTLLLPDSLLVDTLAVLPDTGRASRILPSLRPDLPTARLDRRRVPLGPTLGNYWSRSIELDTLTGDYTIYEQINGWDVRLPQTLDLAAYRDARRQLGLNQSYREIARQRALRRDTRAGFGFGFDIPGGAGRGLRTIFGSDQVDLRVHGQSNVNVGFSYRANEQQEAATGQSGRIDPDFRQELGLSIIGTIGDKLEVNVNYDTQNDFDFQNQVRLTYTGYEDEIIQRIEAGNVFLPVESDLIRGGQRLFGLKADLQIGGLYLTAVASQQDAVSDELNIEGGSQSTPFQLLPTNYEDNAHYYLAYYFYNRWDLAHSTPPNPILGDVRSFENIEIYKFDVSLNAPDVSDDLVAGVAILDLGEPEFVLEGGRAYLENFGENAPAPDMNADRYPESALNALREGGYTSSATARQRLQQNGVDVSVLADADLVVSRFKRLRLNQDYTIDETFGTISLNSPLNESDVLAVAYTYRRADGSLVRVGDVGQGSSSGNVDEGNRIVLKLLRPANIQPDGAAWDLTMRNIYRVGGRGLDPDGFELQIEYAGSGQTAQRTLPGVTVGQGLSLLQFLGLDRLNQAGQPGNDDLFDFLPNYTIRPGSGRVIFPYREPFGDRLENLILGNADLPVLLDGFDSPEQAVQRYVFYSLYREKAETAARDTDLNVYRLTGSSRGSVQAFYNLDFALVEGSVQVRSGEVVLNEGTDYIVDYTGGSIEIINPAYLTPGRDIRISFERQNFTSIQKKTLLGLRAIYEFSDQLAIGGTWMRLTERPLSDKYNVGDEPIANSIWGLDARYEAEPMWITRLIDSLPLIQTRAPSRFEVRGELAQLNPGHPETIAFGRSRDRLTALSETGNPRDFKEDELNGISYIDDFEGAENAFSLIQPGAWRMASGPTGDPTRNVPGAGPDSTETYLSDLGGPADITRPALRSNWRGLFGWYTIPPGTYESGILAGLPRTHASRPIEIKEVFPDREIQRNTPEILTTLDVYFDPLRRGPYNFNAELAGLYSENPDQVWGGMMQRLPDGYRDFEARNNVEFIEFIFSPFGGRMADEALDPNAMLHIDLGRVSEDILPDGELNTEDGLIIPGPIGLWGRRGVGPTTGIVNVNTATMRTDNLGLNGLPSGDICQAAANNGTPYEVCEEQFLEPFLNILRQTMSSSDPRLIQAEMDPGGDDFRSFQDSDYFNNQQIWPGGAVLQERYSMFYAGLEGNSLEVQTQIAGRGTPGLSRIPNSEDVNLDGSLNTWEEFYRYSLPLNPTQLRQSPYFVEEIHNTAIEGSVPWYVIRIPVRSDLRETVGNIDGFRDISAIRMWTDGHTSQVTMRFAKLELVGSQWLKSIELTTGAPDTGRQPTATQNADPVGRMPNLFVATINTEENPSTYRVPNGTVRSYTRDATTGDLIQNREQALVMLVEDFDPGAQAALVKPYTRGMDLTKYSNLRMFVHANGFTRQDSVRVFVRIGSNETNDYYEIEQPLYAWSPPDGMTVAQYEQFLGGGSVSAGVAGTVADSLWQTNVPFEGGFMDLNSINVVFSALNILKVERDLARIEDGTVPWPTDVVYRKSVTDFIETDAGNFAPPGAIVSIRGTPSIQNVTSISFGIRNVGDAGRTIDEAEVWFNELRVSGYDEQSGWSAYIRGTLRLADLADINVRYARQTDAFGELGSGLGDRSFTNEESFQISTNFNVHKFIPERFGWQIPVNLSIQNRTTTPRFSPRRGDITVDQEIEQIRQNPDLTETEKAEEIQAVREAAETVTFSRAIRVPISKTGSRSPLLRYTLDGLALTYTHALDERRTPQRAFDNNDRWTTALTYRLRTPGPQTVRPLWFTEDLPVIGFIGGLRFNVLPQNVRFTADANRSINENQDRRQRGLSQDPLRRALEEAAEQNSNLNQYLRPINRRHTFQHNRTIEVDYNPFEFLSTRFSSRVRQNLDLAGIDPSSERLVQLIADPNRFHEFGDLTLEEIFAYEEQNGTFIPIGPGFQALGITSDLDNYDDIVNAIIQGQFNSFSRSYNVESLTIRPVGTVIGDILSGERQLRTDNYQQTFSATVQSPFERVSWLNWFQLTPITFTSIFNWNYIPLTQFDLEEPITVASLSNQASIRGGLRLRMRDLSGKIGLWNRLEESHRDFEQEKRRASQRRQQERNAYNTARQRVEDARQALEQAEMESVETGEEVPEELYIALEDAIAADTLTLSRPPLPIPNPISLARRLVLTVTGMRDINFTYDGSLGATVGNAVNPGFSLLSSFMGSGPPLSFRFGLDRDMPVTVQDRFFGDDATMLSFDDVFTQEHRLGARTSLEFSTKLRVDLTWDTNFNQRETRSYSYDFGEIVMSLNESGRGQSTVVAFTGSYEGLFNRQVERLRQAGLVEGNTETELFTDALTSNALTEDFRRGYITDLGSFGTGGFFSIPMPNWTVNYTGLGDWPILRSLTQSATLRHGYSATYDLSYRSFSGGSDPRSFQLQGNAGTQNFMLIDEDPPTLRVDEPRINQRFQPLVGVDLNFRGGIQTQFSWNTSTTSALSTANARMTESDTEELSLRFTLTRSGFRLPIPFIRTRLSNQLRLSLLISRANNAQRAFILRDDLQAYFSNQLYQTALPETYLSPIPESSIRTNIQPEISYTLSNSVTASFFVRYERFESENSRIPTTTNINGGFSFRVSFSN